MQSLLFHSNSKMLQKPTYLYFIFILWMIFGARYPSFSNTIPNTNVVTENHVTKALLEKALYYRSINHTKAIDGALETIKIAKEKNHHSEIAAANFLICSMYYGNMNFDSLLTHCHAAYLYYQEKNNLDSLAWLLNFRGIIYDRKGLPIKAESDFKKSLKLFEQTGNKIGMGYCYNDLGVLYNYKDDYSTALDYYYKGLDIFEKENSQEGKLRSYSCLGYFFKKQAQYDKAIDYFTDASTIAKELKELQWELMILRGMVNIYLEGNEMDVAEKYLYQIIEKAAETGNHYESMEAYYNLAKIKYSNGNLSIAELYALKSLEINNEQGLKKYKTSLFRLLASIKLEQNNIEAARIYLSKCDSIDTRSNSKKSLAANYKLWVKYYTMLGMEKTALKYSTLYSDIQDSIHTTEKMNAMVHIQNGFELGRKEVEMAMLNEKYNSQKEKLNLQNHLTKTLTGLIIVSILLLVLVLNLYSIKRNTNKSLEAKIKKRTEELIDANHQLQQSNIELNRFAHIASHDMKEPVRNIVSFIQLVEKKIAGNDMNAALHFLNISKNSSIQLYKLIEDVLEFSKNGKGYQNPIADPNEILASLKASLAQTIQDKNVELIITELPLIKAAEGDVRRLFLNLIGNGIKFNKTGKPVIEISCNIENDIAYFTVKDNGIGIDPEFHQSVFKMFNRLNHRGEYDGTGLGLAICKKIVEKYDGEISVSSKKGHGSAFTFSIAVAASEPVFA